MIVSHQHRYVFVELPRTGTTAISKELRANYAGVSILRKHSTYQDFLKVASPKEREYFAFSCVRNPLDDAVSRYFKTRTDHRGQFSEQRKKRRGMFGLVSRVAYRFVQATRADFPTFFKTFYFLPYSNWSILSHQEYDFVMRFERLPTDFEQALRMIGLEPVRPLPIVNQTNGRDVDFARYYTPEIVGRAQWVFGPYMRLWGYEFPPEWGKAPVSRWSRLAFDSTNLFRKLYWLHLRSVV